MSFTGSPPPASGADCRASARWSQLGRNPHERIVAKPRCARVPELDSSICKLPIFPLIRDLRLGFGFPVATRGVTGPSRHLVAATGFKPRANGCYLRRIVRSHEPGWIPIRRHALPTASRNGCSRSRSRRTAVLVAI